MPRRNRDTHRPQRPKAIAPSTQHEHEHDYIRAGFTTLCATCGLNASEERLNR